MCITPNRLDDGTEVACRKCRLCIRNRKSDWIGRCLAESKFSNKTYAVTLTYAQEAGVSAVTLVYKDVQDFVKRLRKRYNVRYIAAGEYGTKKGRAHWHIILFFKGDYPKVKEDARVDWEYWKKGFSYFQTPTWKGLRYILKYVLKDQDADSADAHLAMSKKPPIGHEFFMDLAKQHVEHAIVPRSFMYKIAGVKTDKGEELKFMMQGKTRDNFMNAFKQGWVEKYGEEPSSKFYEEWDEKNYSVEYTDEEIMKRIHHKDVIYYEPWVQNGAETPEGTWMEAEYYGNEIVIHATEDNAWIFEDGEWREERENVNEILGKSQIKRIRSFEEAQREGLESLVKLREAKQQDRVYQ